jgi:hypothetical protein
MTAERPTTERLREALYRAAERIHGNESHVGTSFIGCPDDPCYEYAAALATPTADTRALDERTLAVAIMRADLATADAIPAGRWDLYAGTIARSILAALPQPEDGGDTHD